MTADRWQQVQALFEQAVQLPLDQRSAFLAQACGTNEDLRAEVESLLEHDAEAARPGFLRPFDGPPRPGAPEEAPTIPQTEPPLAPPAASPPDVTATAGDREAVVPRRGAAPLPPPSTPVPHNPHIEGYEILHELNRGGQGVVYQALQKTTKRKVAIKILLEGPYASKSAHKRFEREIELVAQLRHPNIISVFHSGLTTDGRPFYVMDYVRGLPLHQYVREKKLALEETLKLFATVCEAVQYAHQKGVIHRDLKPGNVLVEADGTPKVMDFGLAKLLAGPLETVVSVSQQLVGTLPYMSPEQARGNPDEIDTRTDVYALGVILYELLTGHYPYPVVGQIVEVLKHIAETPPTPPSRQWKADSGVARRSTGKPRIGQCPIDDEVQTIVLRALTKERERRYQSAGELSRDIGHYLQNEPIEAKRDSAWYVVRKTLRRYKVIGVTVISSNLLGVLFGVVMMLLFQEQRQRTERVEAKLAKIVTDVQVDQQRGQLLGRFANEPEWRVIKRFPGGANIELTHAALINGDKQGTQVIIAGSSKGLAGAENTLAAFDYSGANLWCMDLRSNVAWPDVDAREDQAWPVRTLLAAHVYGRPGDELVVTAHHPFVFPSRVSTIEPLTGKVLQTFWHFGHIDGALVLPDFFRPGRPAIVAWGLNNKLDGISDPIPGDEPPLTKWELVSVVMILDPTRMEGLGPPRTSRLPSLPTATPYAYAFIDTPPSEGVGLQTNERAIPHTGAVPYQVARIAGVRINPSQGKGAGEPLLEVEIEGLSGEKKQFRAFLLVDCSLELLNVVLAQGESSYAWPQVWKPIVQEGEYVSHYPAAAGAATTSSAVTVDLAGVWQHTIPSSDGTQKMLILRGIVDDMGHLAFRFLRQEYSHQPVFDRCTVLGKEVEITFKLVSYDRGDPSPYTLRYFLQKDGADWRGKLFQSWQDPVDVLWERPPKHALP